jgi:hypothetical protein
MTPGDRVAQLYPQALGTHFGRLLPHSWVIVGLFFNPGHHMGIIYTLQPIKKFRVLLVDSGNERKGVGTLFQCIPPKNPA